MITALCLAVFAVFATLSPTFFHDLMGQTAVHTVLIAGAVAGIIQTVKTISPNAITGRWIVVTNTVLSVIGVLVAQGVANFWTETTWAQIAVIVIGASGLHTTTKTLTGLSLTPDSTQGKPAAALALLFVLPALVGCGLNTAGTAPPAPPASIYQQGAQAMDNFAIDLVQAQNIEISLHNGKAIDDTTHAAIQAQFKNVATYGIQIDALIRGQAAATTITDRINSALTSISSIVVASGTLDADTTAKVNAGIAALKLLLTNLLPIFAPSVSLMAPSPHTLEVAFGPRNDRNARRRSSFTRIVYLQPGQGRSDRQDGYVYPEADRRPARRC